VDVGDTEYPNDLGTFHWCPTCTDFVLRSRRFEHPHSIVENKPSVDTVERDKDGNEEYEYGGDEPMEVGGVYRVEKYYEYRVIETTVAADSHLAKDQVDVGDGAVTHELHTEVTEVDEIYEDDKRAEKHDLLP